MSAVLKVAYGLRLGTIVEVSGVVVKNRSREKAYVYEPFFLQIEEVGGKKLKRPHAFSSSEMPLGDEIPGLNVGDRFRCIGYETGGFDGPPDGAFEYIPSYATQGFHFSVEFHVLAVK